jgi:hypothetical protein
MEAGLKLFNRLTEVEKIGLRGATPGRIEYLADTAYKGELFGIGLDERIAIVTEAQALATLESATKADSLTFGLTWKF